MVVVTEEKLKQYKVYVYGMPDKKDVVVYAKTKKTADLILLTFNRTNGFTYTYKHISKSILNRDRLKLYYGQCGEELESKQYECAKKRVRY